jgi:beta-galactosidase
MVAAGITAVRFGEFSWSWYEPEPGQFDFGAFDRFVDLVEERALELCLCTPTAAPPPWMDGLFPDGRLLDMHGRRCLSHRHFWCWNHPAARKKAEETITTLAQQYGRHRCLWGWQIDNEPNYAGQIRLGDPESMYDWNPHSRRAFAVWLEQRHVTIDALNAAWWTNFWSQRVRTWEEAATPRGQSNRGAWLDFMRWRESALAEQIRWQAGLLRRLTPRARIGCNLPETGVKVSVNLGQDYWAQAAAGLDWVGTDLYQATGNRSRDLEQHACSTDLMRSAADAAGAEFFISETQAGPHVRAWPNDFAGEGFKPDYIEQCARVYADHGATRIWWFLWRPTLGGVELGMNGVQNLDGSDTPRTTMVRTIVQRAKILVARRRTWLKRPRAIIHYSRASLLHHSGFTANLQPLNECFDGWHALLEAVGCRVDFVSDDQLVLGAADDVALLVVPFTVVAPDSVVNALVNTPAAIWCGPYMSDCDEHGRLRPEGVPGKWRRRLGAKAGLWRDVGQMPGLHSLGTVRGWRELTPEAAKIRMRYANGAPAILGRGRDLWWSFDAGALFTNARPKQRTAFLTLVRTLQKR